MDIFSYLEKKRSLFILGFIFLAFILLRLPSLFEPLWYGDEGIYQTIGMALKNGRALYSGIWDNKPPLLYILYWYFSSDQFVVRLVSLFFGLFTLLGFFILAQKLLAPFTFIKNYTSNKIAYFATGLFAVLFGLPLLEGNIANAENFMLFFIVISALLVYSHAENHSRTLLFLSGVFLSIAFLFKVVAVFDFAAFTLFLFFSHYKNIASLKRILPVFIPFFGGFFGPILLTFLYFFLAGAFSDFYSGAFGQMVGYVGYNNTFLIGQGLLILKLLALTLFVIFLFLKRYNFPNPILFIFLWTGFSAFNAFFAGRPYTHYLLVLLPSFVLITSLLLLKKNPANQRLYNLLIIVTLFIVSLISFNFRLYKKTAVYYLNFASYITGNKSTEDYYVFFDRATPRDYKLAQYINARSNKNDMLFIWGNNAQVYTLTNKIPPGRFTVAYHMQANKANLSETQKALYAVKPRFIIITSSDNPFPFSISNYAPRYSVGKSIIYEYLL